MSFPTVNTSAISNAFERRDIALYILFASGTVIYYLLPLWAGSFVDDYQFTQSEIGFLLSADMATNTLAAFFSRYWIKKLPWRPVFMTTIAAVTAGNLISMFSSSFELIFFARLLCGLAAGSMVALAYSGLSSHSNPVYQFSLAMSLQILFGIICISISPYVPVETNPGNIFLIITLLNLLPLCFVGWIPARDQHQNDENGGDSIAAITSTQERKNLLFLFSILLFFAAMTTIWVYMERLGVDLDISERSVANILSISLLFSLAGSLSPLVSQSFFSKRTSLYTALAVLFISVVSVPEIEEFVAYATFIMVYNFFYSYAIPYQADLLAEADTTGRSIVLLPAVQGVGIAAGPIFLGFVLAQYSYAVAIYCSAALIVLVFILSSAFLRAPAVHLLPKDTSTL